MNTATFRTPNKEVACSPFPTHAVEPQVQASGFVTAAARTNLVALRVKARHKDLDVWPGDLVYLPLEYANQPWGKRRLKVDGIEGEFILVPVDVVQLVCHD